MLDGLASYASIPTVPSRKLRDPHHSPYNLSQERQLSSRFLQRGLYILASGLTRMCPWGD